MLISSDLSTSQEMFKVALDEVGAMYQLDPTARFPTSIQWQRISGRRWSNSTGMWQPSTPKLELEPYIAIILQASDLIDLCQTATLANHHQSVSDAFPTYQIVYIVAGLDEFYLKEQRSIQAAMNKRMRLTMTQDTSHSNPKKARNTTQPSMPKSVPDRSVVDQMVIEMQLFSRKPCLVNHCRSCDVGMWIASLTEQIAFEPEIRYLQI